MILSPPRRISRSAGSGRPYPTVIFSATATEAPPSRAEVKTSWTTLPGGVLDGGEIVILAIKPSMWRVLFDSAPWLLMCALLAGVLTGLGRPILGLSLTDTAQALMLLALCRVSFAILRWIPAWYVLTNRRIIDIRGVRTPRIRSCPLIDVEDTYLHTSTSEKAAQLGTITFKLDRKDEGPYVWQSIQQPGEVYAKVRSTIDNAREFGNLRQ